VAGKREGVMIDKGQTGMPTTRARDGAPVSLQSWPPALDRNVVYRPGRLDRIVRMSISGSVTKVKRRLIKKTKVQADRRHKRVVSKNQKRELLGTVRGGQTTERKGKK